MSPLAPGRSVGAAGGVPVETPPYYHARGVTTGDVGHQKRPDVRIGARHDRGAMKKNASIPPDHAGANNGRGGWPKPLPDFRTLTVAGTYFRPAGETMNETASGSPPGMGSMLWAGLSPLRFSSEKVRVG